MLYINSSSLNFNYENFLSQEVKDNKEVAAFSVNDSNPYEFNLHLQLDLREKDGTVYGCFEKDITMTINNYNWNSITSTKNGNVVIEDEVWEGTVISFIFEFTTCMS